MKINFLGVALAMLALVGCVAPEPKIANTQSGKPEIVINADVAAIKSQIIGELVNYGYTVEQDSDFMLKLTRPLKGTEDFAAAMALGNSYSSNKRVTVYTFVKQSDGVRVIASSSWSSQLPGGQVHTAELADNGNAFNTFQTQLQQIKARLEK